MSTVEVNPHELMEREFGLETITLGLHPGDGMLFEPLDLSELRLTEMQNFGEHIKQVLANTPYGIQAWKEGISTDSTECLKEE